MKYEQLKPNLILPQLEERLEELKEVLKKHHGTVPVILCICMADGRIAFVDLPEEYYVSATPSLLKDLRGLPGKPGYKIKANMEVPKPKPKYVPREDRTETAEYR